MRRQREPKNYLTKLIDMSIKNQEWNSFFDEFKFFIVTENEIVGVLSENDGDVDSFVICSKNGNEFDIKVELDKKKINEFIKKNEIDVVKNIPEWYTKIDGIKKPDNDGK